MKYAGTETAVAISRLPSHSGPATSSVSFPRPRNIDHSTWYQWSNARALEAASRNSCQRIAGLNSSHVPTR